MTSLLYVCPHVGLRIHNVFISAFQKAVLYFRQVHSSEHNQELVFHGQTSGTAPKLQYHTFNLPSRNQEKELEKPSLPEYIFAVR